MKSFRLVMIFFILAGSISCRKEVEGPAPEKPFLMKIQVTGNYFHPQLGGIIFISDDQGRVLSDVRCHEDGTYTFYGAVGSIVPAWLSVTTVRIEPFWHSYKIVLETFTRIRPTDWAIMGNRIDPAGLYSPSYINIPPHSGPLLISSSGYSNLTFTPGNLPITLFRNPDDLYIGIPMPDGLKYKWFEGITAGQQDTLDLSGAMDAAVHSLKLSSEQVSYYECRVFGYMGTQFSASVSHLISELLSTENPSGTISIEYPPEKFAGYHTEITIVENWSSGIQYDYQTNGSIPSDFVPISAQIENLVIDGYHMQCIASGNFDIQAGKWIYQNPYLGLVEWTIFGPDTASMLMVPQLSPELQSTFPWLSRDSLTFDHAGLNDLSGIQSYTAALRQIFNPSSPSTFERQEFSRIRYSPLN